MTPEELAAVEEFVLGGEAGRRARQQLADDLDTTRTWVDPEGRTPYRLSDRLWRAGETDRAAIEQVLRESLAAGEDAMQTARRLETYLLDDATSQAVQDLTGIRTALPSTRTSYPRSGRGNYAARRLARTEVVRAHGDATMKAAARNPLTKGVRWRLSNRHPKTDICDEHATDNQYDLGEGVYPHGSTPRYPAHPNCICTLSPVLDRRKADEAYQGVLDRIAERRTAPPVAPGLGDGVMDLAARTVTNPMTPEEVLERKMLALIDDDMLTMDQVGDSLEMLRAGQFSQQDIAEFIAESDRIRAAKELERFNQAGVAGRIDIDNFTTDQEAFRAWNDGNQDRMQANMTNSESSSLFRYKQGSGLNSEKRAGAVTSPDTIRIDEGLRSVFDRLIEPSPVPFKVRRGLTFRRDTLVPEYANIRAGDIIVDPGWMSTTVRNDLEMFGVGEGGDLSNLIRYQLEIYAPPGTKAAPMDWVTADKIASQEGELLLPDNTSLLIRRVEKRGNNNWKVIAEVIP